MNKNQRKLHFAFGLLLLLVCCVASAHAQPARRTPRSSREPERQERPQRPQTEGAQVTYDRSVVEQGIKANSVLVRIRYKTEYGYKHESAFGGATGPTSCDAFSVVLAKSARPLREGYLIATVRDPQMTEQDGYYYCEFRVSELALDQDVTISTSVDDQGPWLGGTQAQPPSGWRRALTDNGTRTVTLTQSEPRATMNFEMVYEPMRETVDPRRPPGSLIIKKP